MLERLMERNKDKRVDPKEVVYKLKYAGKFVIVKGKTLWGSLNIIQLAYKQFKREDKRFNSHLYKYFYEHYNRKKGNPHYRFTVKILAKASVNVDHFELLKVEQNELDKNRTNPACLNNATEAYIPQLKPGADKYGWIDRDAVDRFRKWLKSKERGLSTNRYRKKLTQEPAMSDL